MIKHYFLSLTLLAGGLLGPNMAHPGALLWMLHFEIPHKKILFFAEQHYGKLENGQKVEKIADKQAMPLFNLFDDLERNNQKCSLYLECREGLTKNPSGLDGRAWFDTCMISYARGQEIPSWATSVRNFDPRTQRELFLLKDVFRFDKCMDDWKDAEYSPQAYERIMKGFEQGEGFDEDEIESNEELTDESESKEGSSAFVDDDYDELPKEIYQKLDGAIAELKKVIPPIDTALFNKWTQECLKYKQPLANLYAAKAKTNKKQLFGYLFAMARDYKEKFYEKLSEKLKCKESIESVATLFEAIDHYSDSVLLHKILSDPNQVIVVHAGADHLDTIYNTYFSESKMETRGKDPLYLNTDDMINHPDYCYQHMRELVFGN
jgi:hypothetical protein